MYQDVSPDTQYWTDPLGGPQMVPAAVAARQRKDARRDERDKIGKQVLDKVQQSNIGGALGPSTALPNATANDAPSIMANTPPVHSGDPYGGTVNLTGGSANVGNPYLGPVPQETLPAPYTPPELKQAQYKPPNKGLEYLAAGVALLFPGAPIGHAATGLLQGMQQGAQQKYQREEQQDLQQYQVQEKGAEAAYQNALEKSKVDFENAQLRYTQNQAILQQGIDPRTGQPIQEISEAAIQHYLPKSVDPKTKRVTVDNSARGYAEAYRAMASRAIQIGATDLGKQYDAQSADYTRQAQADQTQAAALNRTILEINAANARHEDTMAIEGARLNLEAYRVSNEQGGKAFEYRTQAATAGSEFMKNWQKAISNPVDQNGNPIHAAPPTFSGAVVPALGKAFSSIDRSSDPSAYANWLSEHLDKVAPGLSAQQAASAKQLFLDRAKAADLNRRAQGLGIGGFVAPKNLPTTHAGNGKPAQGGYEVGKTYQGQSYLGGDPHDPTNWTKP